MDPSNQFSLKNNYIPFTRTKTNVLLQNMSFILQ